MPSFRIFEFPTANDDAQSDGGNLEAIRDGFSFKALYFTPLWLFAKRLWVAFFIYVAFLAALVLLAISIDPVSAALILALSGFLIALEAKSWEAAALTYRGWREQAIIVADTAEQAVLRYLQERERTVSSPNLMGAAQTSSISTGMI